ncbi:MAG: PKD domain-containing protein [Bacteroidota bacterium]|nr:PKD domain-containing protein [Bacteroidota bacterium]
MRKFYALVCILITIQTTHTQAQTYCTPSYTGYGYWNGATNVQNTPSSFFTHIKNVTLADMNVSTAAPQGNPSSNYDDNTLETARVAKGAAYPLSIFLGNGANSQIVAVWIDYNQNGTFESTERVFSAFDQMNVGNHIAGTNITIPVNAKTGATRMRVGTVYSNTNAAANTPDPCTNNDANTTTLKWSQYFQDFTVDVFPPSAQTYKSSDVAQINFDEVTQGSTDNQILRIVVENNPGGTLSPLTIGNFNFSTLGTSNPAELSKAKLYYTGNNANFGITNQVGSAVSSPSGSFAINANQNLKQGQNYFWLVYDISSGALLGNTIDARCYSIEINSIKRIPANVNPGGNRRVGYCVSRGNQTNFIGVYSVQMGTISNSSYFQQSSGYVDYTYLSDTIDRGNAQTIGVVCGNGVNATRVRAWIDFNHNGVLDPTTEKVLDTFNFTNNQAQGSYVLLQQNFNVPSTAVCGPTRMRVSTQSYPVTAQGPCTNPIQIGEVEDYTVVIRENGQPVSEFKAGASCLGSQTDFYDRSYTFGNYNITSWRWEFGDGKVDSVNQNPSHTYASAGVYNVKLTTNTNLPGTPSVITNAVTVEKPKADFITDLNVYQVPITFNDITTGGEVIFWSWNFGDPQSGILNSTYQSQPTHTFDTAGVYIITLMVITKGGCIDSIKKTIIILQKQQPISDFTANTFNPYIYESVSLVDQSVNQPDQWKWTFSPNKISFKNSTNDTTQNPTVSFDSVTTYTVFLEAKNIAGSSTSNRQFIVKNYTSPKVGFYATPLTVKVGQQVSFIDTSLNDPTKWAWDFGDTISGSNNTSNIQFPFHTFANAGKYKISLLVQNPAGKDSIVKTQYINVTNQFNMCDNTAVVSTAYKGYIYDSGGPVSNYNDGSGCGFLIEPTCAGKIVISFTALDMQANDYVQVFDGVDATGKPLHPGLGFTGTNSPGSLTANSGSIYIKEITDGNNNSAGFAASWTAFANQKPKAKINADSVAYINSPYNLRNATQTGSGNKYQWEVDGDGVIDDTLFNTSYTYTSLGKQTIMLVATNCAGTDTVYKTINVKNPTAVPVVNFLSDQDTVYPNDPIQLTDLSTNGPTSWFWEFSPANQIFFINGDEFSQNPQIGFLTSGNYTICLTATNVIGNSVKVCKTNLVIVKELAQMCIFPYETTVAAGSLFDSGGPNSNYSDNENCTYKIGPCNSEIELKFNKFNLSNGDYIRVYDGADNTGTPLYSGLGYSGSNIPGPFLAYSGNMYIEFTSNAQGNSAGFAGEWNSKVLQAAVADFIVPTKVYNSGVTHFVNSSQNGTTYEWDFDGNGTTDSTTTNGDWKFTTTGNVDVTLTVTNCLGITFITKTISVVAPTAKPVAGFTTDFTIADTMQVITLRDTSTNGPKTWSWQITPAATVSMLNGSNDYTAVLSFSDTGDYKVCLTVSNNFGNDNVCRTAYIHVSAICRPNPTLINGVGLNRVGINNTTRTTSSIQGYTDYTNLGVVYNIERKAKTTYRLEKFDIGTNQNWRAWVDYNQDGDFDINSERVINDAPTSNQVVSGSFTVPASAKVGITRLRVAVSYNNNQNQPCNVAFGEVEDYFVLISDDKTPPVLTLIGNNPDTVEQGLTYNDPGATAIDNVDGNISANVVASSNINNQVVGSYIVKYNVKDSAGNKAAEVQRTIYVLPDNSGPSITLLGVDSQYLEVHNKYIEAGATAIDSMDGNVTNTIIISGTVDTGKLGWYPVTYTATDKSKNINTRVRMVQVGDTTRPVITLIGKDTIYIFINANFTDPGVKATDNYDVVVPASVVRTGTVNNTVKGWYQLDYNVKDKQNNAANTVSRWVNVDANAINVPTDKSFELYPNPTADKLNIQLQQNSNATRWTVYDATGKLIVNGSLRGSTQIDVTAMAKGLYHLQLIDANGHIIGSKQFVKE